MISSPPVSVVMNAYNKEEYIGQTIESILGQTFGDFEFIIVNDGSTDNTSEVIAKYKDSRIRVFHHENRGIRATLNRGFGEAGGKYIAHIDADDVATPNRLQVQFDFMEKHPDHVLIGCWCKVLNENNDIVELWRPPMDDMGIRWAQLFDNVLGHSGFFIRREIMDGEEWYKTPYAEEYDLAVRLSQKGKLACIPEVLVIYRDLVEGGITDTKWSQQKGFSEKISMAQLADMMKEDVVTPEQRYAVWKLIYRPWLIEEPQTSLAVETLKKIAVAFCSTYSCPETSVAVRNAFASYAKKLMLPVQGGRINQFQNLKTALKLSTQMADIKNIIAALICCAVGPGPGSRITSEMKFKLQLLFKTKI